ncbi:MAG: LysR family transcriptional regulator [Atopobiaceae bacterium]|nr:LysR family transcriptional regulator [Atopobiaceae bacterium]
MNLRQLEYFMAIAEEHQLTAAAKRLHIMQPPLSYELSSLERELGVKLVSHTSRSVELMDAEKLLYVRAAQIVDATSSAEREVKNFAAGAKRHARYWPRLVCLWTYLQQCDALAYQRLPCRKARVARARHDRSARHT